MNYQKRKKQQQLFTKQKNSYLKSLKVNPSFQNSVDAHGFALCKDIAIIPIIKGMIEEEYDSAE